MTANIHLAIPARDLSTTEKYYTDILLCRLGNGEGDRWVDVNFWGNELTLHQRKEKLPNVRNVITVIVRL